MGYYSDVMLITDVENTEIIYSIFEEFAGSGDPPNILEWSENPEGFEWERYENRGLGQTSVEIPLIMWEWKSMRWGYGFTRTDEIEKALDKALTYADTSMHPTALYAHYGLIVIGEELEDIRLEGSPWDYGMDVNRTIEW